MKQLLVLNHTNLDRLRVRVSTCKSRLRVSEGNERTQFGPYASYWDEWCLEAEAIIEDLHSDIAATLHFASELREFIAAIEAENSDSGAKAKRICKMQKLTLEALACQKDMISITDMRLAEHRAFTHKLLLVEAIDSLDD